jgi:hypothetical protein
MSYPEKPMPSTEYSLKSISWHLKEISESLKTITRIAIEAMAKSQISPQNKPHQQQQSDDMPF